MRLNRRALPDCSLADIARAQTGAVNVFRRHQLDLGCDGHRTLADAAVAKGLSLETLEAELAAEALHVAERSLPTEALIGHIEARYHAAHRRQLPQLIGLAKQVQAAH